MEFLLYHLAKENQDYIDFFRKMKKYKIFDNSFYELRKEIDYDDYFNYAEMLDVDEIILPDKLWDGEWTRQKVEEVLNEYYDYIKSQNWKVAAVVQGRNLDDMIKTLIQFGNDERIDVIMIPRKVLFEKQWKFHSEKIRSYSDARWWVFEELYRIGFNNKPVHFLGANSLWEILKVKHDERIRSIDTKWFSKMVLDGKWEKWDELSRFPIEMLEEIYEKTKPLLKYDEKYGVV